MSEATAAVKPVAVEKRKNVQVATTITAEQFDAMVDYKWSGSRLEVRDQVKEALEDYFAKNGHKVDGSAPHADPKEK